MKKIQLIHNESPLYRLNYHINTKTDIWIKRDDLLEFAFGGNKVRLFEYIAAQIVEGDYERIVTYGSQYSNYLRVTAAVCAKLKIQCDLIVLREKRNITGGNENLLRWFDGANIVQCDEEEAHEFIDCYRDRLEQNGIKYYWIPGGGHITQAAFGYVDASEIMKQQLNKMNVDIDAVFLPCGTGTTQAGVLWGMAGFAEVYGVSIARTKSRCIDEIEKTINEMKGIAPNKGEINRCDINVLHNESLHYGEIDDHIKDIMRKVAVSDGVFLDPIYNAKAFAGMEDYVTESEFSGNILYINTGGQPNIFMREE